MSRFKPQVSYITRESVRAHQDSYGKKSRQITKQYDTYRELLKNIQKHCAENLEAETSVSRSKRSEWGEWFEIWGWGSNGKYEIIKEGWN